ncbi:uncharacterized protein LOC107364766 [Tetranychus urticae]|uniref:Cystatin domain-containing protein n=1 Tax=Tetranychus urticae TaxID=32264 RepID=T1KKR9_TETUR|nr:uncharacterized protein LOC107364766 [Tetranychus urticae]
MTTIYLNCIVLITIGLFIATSDSFVIHPLKAKDAYKPIPTTDPMVVKDVNFVVSEINRLSATKYLVKPLKIKKSAILLNEYINLTFEVGTTVCLKGSSTPLDKCTLDAKKPTTICKEVIVDNTPWREVKMKVTQFGNCQP